MNNKLKNILFENGYSLLSVTIKPNLNLTKNDCENEVLFTITRFVEDKNKKPNFEKL
jgi:hypothetical protein